jgi:hypothetical protein
MRTSSLPLSKNKLATLSITISISLEANEWQGNIPGRQTELNVELVSSGTYKRGRQLVIHSNNGVLD